ncbi:hypothetical protein [Cytobacillus purgationiresistens]|uniref:Uncharacterized protein n=1 Tax=Cytobacillus purgationiresistens TaxID=863449 RepID=A0ABU0ANL4_9BACI|nr:hypothetical protein [Cytobacillus purgationiresistens]MDQ0272852.1 hypothetical protein [Cytobacillus purgationiresistens]
MSISIDTDNSARLVIVLFFDSVFGSSGVLINVVLTLLWDSLLV